jgi:hypothetical protein
MGRRQSQAAPQADRAWTLLSADRIFAADAACECGHKHDAGVGVQDTVVR